MTETEWILPAPPPADGPTTGPDRPLLVGFLDWQRRTLLNVSAGLTAEQLTRRPVPSSALSLLGLIRHLTKVERIWFRQRIAGQDVPPLFDPARGRRFDFDGGTADTAEHDVAALQQEWRDADTAAAGCDLDHEIEVHGDTMSLRMVYVHMIYEYGRHNGHADLLREAIDGVTAR